MIDTDATTDESTTIVPLVVAVCAITTAVVIAKRVATNRKIKWINRNGYRVVDL